VCIYIPVPLFLCLSLSRLTSLSSSFSVSLFF